MAAVRAADVVAAVSVATAHHLPLAVQATGHGAVASFEGGVLITTSRMRSVEVDPARRTAVVGAGARWSDVLDAAAGAGLAAVSGSSGQVGVVGFCLGGGIGPLSRKYGFGADRVRTVELVTADGRLRRIDASSDPELFWAVRGGKGNLGIVTSLEIDLVPVPQVYAGTVFFDGAAAAEVLHSFRTWAPLLPDRSSASVALLQLPPLEIVPEPLRGHSVVHLRFTHDGSAHDATEILAPMLEAGPVLLSSCGELPYSAVDVVHRDPTTPMPAWERGMLLGELAADGVERLVSLAGSASGTPLAMVELRLMGGALARQPSVPNAVAGREGAYSLLALGVLAPGLEEAVPAAGTAVLEAMAPWATGTALVNFLGAASPAEVRAAWCPDVLDRLLAVKRRIDPDNVFGFGHALVR